ncbi:MAG: signal peptidase II, partial [Clostridium sp.]|nr:signal peptidase II [Clostridium sp.]
MSRQKRSLLVSFLIGFLILVGLDQWTKGLAVRFL